MEPDEITGLSNEALAEAIAKFQADLDAALAVEAPTRENVQQARELNETLSALEAEKATRDEDAAEFAAIQQANAARVEAAADEGDEDEDEEEDEEDEPEEQAVTASARSKVARRRTPPPPEEDEEEDETPRVSITASADVPGFGAGLEMTGLTDVGAAMIARMNAFPKAFGQRGAQRQRFGVASITKPMPDHLRSKGGVDADFAVVEAAAREASLPQGSLTAAGGWCAPSERLWDLCKIETTDGLVSVPEFEVARGGVEHTTGADFSDLYDASGIQTEAEAIAGEEKDCYEIECPEWAEVRLDASYLCIRVPLLTQAGFPELITNTMERALIAYQHKQSADVISRISTLIGTAEVVASQGSTAANTLSALELVADQKRQDYRLSQSQSMEVLLPFWVKAAIRADLALRTGVDMLAVSDAQIQAHFATRNLAVQWLYNWQANTEEGAFPATFDALMYPAGTYVKGTKNVINLDAVYDAASLSVNMRTGLFFEEGILVLGRCQPSAKVTITVCSAGRTGAADNDECLVPAPVGP